MFVSFITRNAYEIERAVPDRPTGGPRRSTTDFSSTCDGRSARRQSQIPSRQSRICARFTSSVQAFERRRHCAGRSEELILPQAGTTSSTTGTSTSYNGSSATGSTTLTVAALATLTTGATTSLGSAGGSSARWLSLNDAIATVDASARSLRGLQWATTQVLR